jgi:hypothetical protein
LIDRSPAVIDPVSVRAKKGAFRQPTNDGEWLESLVEAVPAVRSRRGPHGRKPGKLHTDNAYDSADLR